MKVLLLKDVYKLGRAGDVKKVANGYGRNYLIPQGFAVLATVGAMKKADNIREKATLERAKLNEEMSSVAEVLEGQVLTFAARAGETGKLYGSVTTRNIADAIKAKFDMDVDHRNIDVQPLRNLGVFDVPIRLTLDLIPTVKAVVHREGETPLMPGEEPEEEVEETVDVEETAPVVEEDVETEDEE
jgi:large subunit ribosomal protein L9